MKGDLKKNTINIFNSNFGRYLNRQKKYNLQSKNIIMCLNLMQRCILMLKISNNFDIEC